MAAAHKSLRLGDIAPDFEEETTAGPIKFHDWIGDSWVSIFTYYGRRCPNDPTISRQFCSPIQETSPQSAPPSLEKLLAGPLTSPLAMSR